MRHNIAPFINIIVEPGVCSDGYGSEDTTKLDIFKGLFMITLNTTCYRCHEPLTATFCLGSRVSAEPEWKTETVHCRKCDVYQIKKIRFYAEDVREGMPYDPNDPTECATEFDQCYIAKEKSADCSSCPYRGKCNKED